jgi:hypothetical protein
MMTRLPVTGLRDQGFPAKAAPPCALPVFAFGVSRVDRDSPSNGTKALLVPRRA